MHIHALQINLSAHYNRLCRSSRIKQLVLDRHGKPGVLRIEEVPVPDVKKGELIVRMMQRPENPRYGSVSVVIFYHMVNLCSEIIAIFIVCKNSLIIYSNSIH